MFVYGLHRHPMWGSDAEEFKPERWLDPASLPACPNAFAAFNMGRRICIGHLPVIGHVHHVFGNSTMITDIDDCMTVANSCLEKGSFYEFGKVWLGEGLVTASVSKWKKHRKILNTAFNQQMLDGFLSIFNFQARRLCNELELKEDGISFDIGDYLQRFALETIYCTATGVDLDHEESLNKKFRDAANNIAGITSDRALKFWLHNDFTWNRSNDKIKMDKDLNFLNGILNMIIKKRMENDNNPDVKNTSGESLKTFSDILFHLKDTDGEKVFTDQDVKDHVTTLIVAGYDTVALSLLYTILLIGSYPKVQNKIYAELADVFGKSDRDVTKIDLSRLVYLDAALKESIRLYPVAPYIARLLDRDIKLKNLTLYSGNSCYMSIYGINRHPIWGSDADQFKPERWLDPARLPKNRNYFASFSFGRRNCIGKSYATMWMKIVLVYILRRYVITGDHTKTVSMYEVLLKPVSGHLVTVEKRK
ncbi:cytochrome P450 4C1-like [Battus philenor]|uniref:cytochrome P450 4C1-like n=1 Tax=Battus philenor TaxID=42288 RepID=UPI0035D080C7